MKTEVFNNNKKVRWSEFRNYGIESKTRKNLIAAV